VNKFDRAASARAYAEEVGGILCDLPTPSINAAVMRGAGVRFSSPAERLPGPRWLVLEGPSPTVRSLPECRLRRCSSGSART
jgi:hypothetical protein